MATVAITATPQQVGIPPGTPCTTSAPLTFGYTSATAASGPTIPTGSFNWPGVYVGNYGAVSLWVATATTANLVYVS